MTRSSIAVATIAAAALAASLGAVSAARAAGPAHEITHLSMRHGAKPAAKNGTRLRVWFHSIPTAVGRKTGRRTGRAFRRR